METEPSFDPTEPLYCIAWVDKVRGTKGRGKNRFTFREASRLAAILNEDYPNIEHQIMPLYENPN